jgi:hypothetical protein
MTKRPSDETREALIASARAGQLDASETAELSLLADVLGDPSVWSEPGSGLEDAVANAVAAAPPAAVDARAAVRPRRRRVALSIVAAAAAIVILLGVVAVARRETNSDFESRLTATALAPGASGTAEMYRNDAGFKVELDAHELPRLPNDEYYQAWLKNAADTLVPIGTFSSSDGRVILWSGVSPEDFPTITVTIEALDNDQSSSGRRVLVGPVHAN